MAEKPILFNGEMVRAIMDGTKTQTRRPIKKCSPGVDVKMMCHNEGRHNQAMTVGQGEDTQFFSSPFGLPGDSLWVRETWRWDHSENDAFYRCDGSSTRFLSPDENVISWAFNDWNNRKHRHAQWNARWRPSIHMPRWASRINLKVNRVWVERVRDISNHDVYWEGSPGLSPQQWGERWDRIYGKKDYGWNDNPWVWCCKFEVMA